MQDKWNPDNPSFGTVQQDLGRVVQGHDPSTLKNIIGAGVVNAIQHDLRPTEVRETFDTALEYAVQHQHALGQIPTSTR